jgi:hypothetical protein
MSEPRHSIWMNPWTITIVGAVIAGIILAFVLPTLKSNSPPGTPPTESNQTATTASSTQQPVPSARVAVRYQGPIAVNSNGVDLDAIPPATNDNNPTLYQDAGGVLRTYNATVAVWTGSSMPTYSQCHNLALTQGGGASPQLTSGLDVCVITAAGHTAYVQISNQSTNGWEAHVTVWNQ